MWHSYGLSIGGASFVCFITLSLSLSQSFIIIIVPFLIENPKSLNQLIMNSIDPMRQHLIHLESSILNIDGNDSVRNTDCWRIMSAPDENNTSDHTKTP
uniref:Uncharacterized protein n=1 Tax=Helianthus annuus TaxID=4232 RepID=A0A251VIE7_HELAN